MRRGTPRLLRCCKSILIILCSLEIGACECVFRVFPHPLPQHRQVPRVLSEDIFREIIASMVDSQVCKLGLDSQARQGWSNLLMYRDLPLDARQVREEADLGHEDMINAVATLGRGMLPDVICLSVGISHEVCDSRDRVLIDPFVTVRPRDIISPHKRQTQISCVCKVIPPAHQVYFICPVGRDVRQSGRRLFVSDDDDLVRDRVYASEHTNHQAMIACCHDNIPAQSASGFC